MDGVSLQCSQDIQQVQELREDPEDQTDLEDPGGQHREDIDQMESNFDLLTPRLL